MNRERVVAMKPGPEEVDGKFDDGKRPGHLPPPPKVPRLQDLLPPEDRALHRLTMKRYRAARTRETELQRRIDRARSRD